MSRTSVRVLTASFSLLALLLVSTAAAGQSTLLYPHRETTVAWSMLGASEASDLSVILGGRAINDTSTVGFNVAVSENYGPSLGVTLEIGKTSFSEGIVGLERWTVLAGAKFTLRRGNRVIPFGQLLVGPAHYNVSMLTASVGDLKVALQPGGGVDIVLSSAMALRLGFDARVVFDRRPFSGDSINQFRFTTGFTYRSNFRF